MLLASEIIGCSLKNYFGVIDDIIQFLNKNKSTYYITQDFINTADINRIYAETCVNHIITINPLYSVVEKSKIRENNLTEINSRYKSKPANDERNIDFTTFLNIGSEISPKPIHGEYPLFSAFTSGTTGDPKEVIHSSKSIIGIVEQLSLFPNKSKQRDTWLLTLLPPTLVAVVVAMIIYPLADGKRLILDPYCRLEDIDLEMMHYEPNCWPTIPIFFSILLNSKRIPKNYDMSYFKLFGFGAEPLHYKFINEVQDFLERHNCKSQLGVGYGQSEGGSDFTVTAGVDMLKIGSSGFPLIDTTISIFKPGTTEELKYNEVGEIAKAGPGIMLGYQSEELTKTVLKVHSDGTTWLHTGDTGFMNENGLLFVLGREGIHVFPNKRVFSLCIENKILTIKGIREAIVTSGKDKNHDGYPMFHGYGLSEEFSVISVDKANAFNDIEFGKDVVDVGIPYPSITVGIFDEYGNELGYNQRGELCIKSNTAMKGYFEKPELTEKAFRNGWLRTGDLFEIDENGVLYCYGRLSDKLTLPGNKTLYLFDIANELCKDPNVKYAIVNCMGIKDGIYMLAAHLVLHDTDKDAENIIKILDKKIIEFLPADVSIAGYKVHACGFRVSPTTAKKDRNYYAQQLSGYVKPTETGLFEVNFE